MSSSCPSVLFVSHSASRNGASILLLDLIRWIKERMPWEIHVVVQGDGPLLPEFRAVATTTWVWRDPRRRLRALFGESGEAAQRAIARGHGWVNTPRCRYDLVYANTIAVAPLVGVLRGKSPPLLWHIHELSYALRLYSLGQGDGVAIRSTDRVIAASDAVKSALIGEFAVSPERISVVHSFTSLHEVSPASRQSRRAEIRSRLQIPQNAFVVGACGTHGWRKGTDLFARIAQQAFDLNGQQEMHFLWVGGAPTTREWLEFTHDLRILGVEGLVHLVPDTPDVAGHYCAMDAFALTSREDPFPLVLLEAANHALPIVCFSNAGGAVEFVGHDAGLCVPYLDTAAFADRLVQLHGRADLRERLGAAARQKVQQRFNLGARAPDILDVMQECLASAASSVGCIVGPNGSSMSLGDAE